MPRRRLLVKGIVQGVGYRASAHFEANRLGLRGWVRNRRDGRVEAVVDGDDESVAAFVAWCKRGPTGSRVDGVEVEDEPEDETLGAFQVRPTA